VTYSGSPRRAPISGWNKYNGGIIGQMVWSLSEPTDARLWWPCKDRPDDKASVEEWWTVKSGWTATGNGVLQGVDTVGTRVRYRWVATHPLTTYLVSIAATDYAKFTDSYAPLAGGTMPLEHYVYPEYLANAQVSFSNTPQMISYFAQTFGEYPFVEDKYGMSAFPFGGAMEHSTNTSYGYTLINGGHNYDFVVAHELSHQWWGDSVSPQTWADIWLNEGFASYCEALWAEHLGELRVLPQLHEFDVSLRLLGAGLQQLEQLRHDRLRQGRLGPAHAPARAGDASFFDMMRTWYATYEDGGGQHRALPANGGRPTEARSTGSSGMGLRPEHAELPVRLEDGEPRRGILPDLRADRAGADQRADLHDADRPDARDRRGEPDTDGLEQRGGPGSSSTPPRRSPRSPSTCFELGAQDRRGDTHARRRGCGRRPRSATTTARRRPARKQLDTDLDGAGNACDSDDDNDQLADAVDCAPLDAARGATGRWPS
jgi:hypothetical protein